MTPLEKRMHFHRVAQLPCMARACGQYPVTLHHAKGGSLVQEGVHRTGFRRPSSYLVLPICHRHHVGAEGIDSGAMTTAEWEERYGSQADMLRSLGSVLKLDLFDLAKNDRPERKYRRSSKILPRAHE